MRMDVPEHTSMRIPAESRRKGRYVFLTGWQDAPAEMDNRAEVRRRLNPVHHTPVNSHVVAAANVPMA